MSATHARGSKPSSKTLIESAFHTDGVRAVDRRIAELRERIRATSPRSAKQIEGYRDEIDHLLDLRIWLTAPVRV